MDRQAGRCTLGAEGVAPPFAFSMAFQPVVDIDAGRVYAYEALVRGPAGEGSATVLDQVTAGNRSAFDQSCRVAALTLAGRLGLVETGARLSINVMATAMERPEACVRPTVDLARRVGIPPECLILELAEGEPGVAPAHRASIVGAHRAQGVQTAIDDFGGGFSGLSSLTACEPDMVKLDMALIRGVDHDRRRQAIVGALVGMCRDLRVRVVAEGVETVGELTALHALGIGLVQGYLLARPAFERLPAVRL